MSPGQGTGQALVVTATGRMVVGATCVTSRLVTPKPPAWVRSKTRIYETSGPGPSLDKPYHKRHRPPELHARRAPISGGHVGLQAVRAKEGNESQRRTVTLRWDVEMLL